MSVLHDVPGSEVGDTVQSFVEDGKTHITLVKHAGEDLWEITAT